jgi:hypothetical protein
MKKLVLLISIILAHTVLIHASNHIEPVPSAHAPGSLSWFSSLSLKEVQQLAGRKLTLKEKISVKVCQWKIKKELKQPKKKEGKTKGAMAQLFGIIGIISLFVPFVGPLAALVFGILAIVVGNKAREIDPDDRKAKTGIVLGWITVGLFIAALIIVIAVLSTWSFGG